jgi:two-component system CheB/CheR fusion protein
MSVTTVTDEVELKRDCVFVMTRSAILTVKQRRLIVRQTGSRRERKPIDIFFSSLATDVGELAAGVVLSGGDSDGTLGIKAIKERGGLTFAQVGDGFGPGHPDMPESAIAAGFVDFAIPVEEMGEKLVQFARGGLDFETLLEASQDDAEQRSIREAMPEIFSLLHNQIGHDFSGYKINTFMRRVARRMHVTQHTSIRLSRAAAAGAEGGARSVP